VLTVLVAVAGPCACVALVVAGRRAATAERARALRPPPGWRLPARVRVPAAAALQAADVDWTPEDAVARWTIAVVANAALAAAFSPFFAVIAGGATIAAAPIALVVARGRRERAFSTALPVALEQVAAELRGGGTVGGAIERLAVSRGPVASDLRRVQVRTGLGLPLADALARWPVDHDTGEVRAAAGALAVAATMGGRAADAIDGLAASFRRRLDVVAEANALSAQARLSAVVVGAAPVGYLAFSAMVDPGSVAALVGTGVGRTCLVVGLGLEVLAAWCIRRILRSAG
jgi:tight adherence protein B